MPLYIRNIRKSTNASTITDYRPIIVFYQLYPKLFIYLFRVGHCKKKIWLILSKVPGARLISILKISAVGQKFLDF